MILPSATKMPPTNIPRFASFRPKPTPTSEQDVQTRDNNIQEEEGNPRNSKSKSDHRPRTHKHKNRQSRTKLEHFLSTKDIVSRAVPADAPSIFVVDRKGDKKNVIFGSMHRYDVPSFHRFGEGHVLGASTGLKIDRDLDDGRQIVLRNCQTFGNSRKREKYVFSKVEKDKPRLLRVRPAIQTSENLDDVHADFVPFQLTRGRKRKRAHNGHDDSSGTDQDTGDYRSIYGKAKDQSQPQDPDLQYATESDLSGSEAGRTITLNSAVREKNVILSRNVEESPHDINAWLALIGHQDALIGAGDDRRRITNAEIRSTSDIKIHMYEKALEKMRSLADREKLLQGLMTEGAKIWELKAQATRWEQIARENIDSLLLWTSYLNFKQSTFSTYLYEEVKELYLSRIKLLLQTIRDTNAISTHSLFEQLIYVLLRFTSYVRESGYVELSLAIWQGLLELNFCSPEQELTNEAIIKLFQEFWDSEVPRLGEEGSRGWRQHIVNEDLSHVPDPTTDEPHGSLDTSQIFTSWAIAERKRSNCSRLPARTMDEVVEDDAFRVILLSDIQDFLILFPSSLRPVYINAFLLFCRLPPLSPEISQSRKWSTDQFIRNELLDLSVSKARQSLSYEESEGEKNGIESVKRSLLPNSCIDYQTLYASRTLQRTPSLRDQYGGDHGPVPYQFIRNMLKQLTHHGFTEDLAQYYLAFEYANELETIKKVAKGLLKQHPSSLRLYNAYALIEWSRGNKGVANGVFSAAIGMSRSKTDHEVNADSILLWTSIIWCYLEDSDSSGALNILLSIPDGVINAELASSPTATLRAKQYLLSTRDFLSSSGDLEHAVLYTECLTLLIYLSSNSTSEPTSPAQGNISSALISLLNFTATIRSPTLTNHQEVLYQVAARLIYHHCTHGPYRPSLVREHLTKYLAAFPQNTLFLSLYIANESRLRVENRVRTLFLNTLLTPENDCLTTRVSSIRYEISYGTTHSAKAAFEKAVASPVAGHSPGLWRLYLLWNVDNDVKLAGSKKGKSKGLAMEIWYRALRACPWAKELYVLGFELLGDNKGIEYAELKGTWRVMGEKELRVHVDLEDEFEIFEEERAIRNS